MRRVIIESPFGSRIDGTRASPDEMARNIEYARRAMKDCLDRGEAPYASHLLYPQVYDEATPEERKRGMEAGWAWAEVADQAIVYGDYGITPGMQAGLNRHSIENDGWGLPVERRTIGLNPEVDNNDLAACLRVEPETSADRVMQLMGRWETTLTLHEKGFIDDNTKNRLRAYVIEELNKP